MKKNSILVVVLVCIIVLLGGFIVYDKFFVKDSNVQQNENQEDNNVENGITVYQNGRIVNISALSSLKGTYQGYNDGKKNNEYIVISDKISECEISNIESFGGIANGKREIVAVKAYLFANWRHMESDNVINCFVIEFSIKEDTNIRNYMFFGVDTNDGYEIHPISNSETMYYSLSN